MINALAEKAEATQAVISGIRKRTGVEGARRFDAREQVYRIDRILHFLHHERDARGATDAEKALCTEIKDRLTARNAW